MLYAIANELGQALIRKSVPFPVLFGPEPTRSLTSASGRIVIEQPVDEKRDAIVPPRGLHINPRSPLRRMQSARLRIYAKSAVTNAQWHDHCELAEHVLDHVLSELDELARARRNAITFGAGGFVSLEDANGSLIWSSAVYELDFAIDRDVSRVTWFGDANPEKIIGVDVTLVSGTKVSPGPGPAGTPPVDAETIPGG